MARGPLICVAALCVALAGCNKSSTPPTDMGSPEGSTDDMQRPDGATVADQLALDLPRGDTLVGSDAGTLVAGDWVMVQPGTFTMGSPTGESCRYSNETPHDVTLTHPFWIQTTEVTQGAFKSLMGYSPSDFYICGADCPVESVSWHEAVAYCNALSAKIGASQCYACTGSGSSSTCSEATAFGGSNVYLCPGYRLPTDAEWEYAYRSGTQTAFYNGPITACASDPKADQIGWYSKNCGETQPVGQKQASAWGLHDMAGNVFEWCHDWFQKDLGPSTATDPWGPATGTARALRGGSWYGLAQDMRAANRKSMPPTSLGYDVGFRCVRTVPTP